MEGRLPLGGPLSYCRGHIVFNIFLCHSGEKQHLWLISSYFLQWQYPFLGMTVFNKVQISWRGRQLDNGPIYKWGEVQKKFGNHGPRFNATRLRPVSCPWYLEKGKAAEVLLFLVSMEQKLPPKALLFRSKLFCFFLLTTLITWDTAEFKFLGYNKGFFYILKFFVFFNSLL